MVRFDLKDEEWRLFNPYCSNVGGALPGGMAGRSWSKLRLIGSISSGIEEVVALLTGEEIADVHDGVPEIFVCAGG